MYPFDFASGRSLNPTHLITGNHTFMACRLEQHPSSRSKPSWRSSRAHCLVKRITATLAMLMRRSHYIKSNPSSSLQYSNPSTGLKYILSNYGFFEYLNLNRTRELGNVWRFSNRKKSTIFIELCKVSKTSKIDNEKNPTSLRTKEKAFNPTSFPLLLDPHHTFTLRYKQAAKENLRQEHSLTLFHPHLQQERCCDQLPKLQKWIPSPIPKKPAQTGSLAFLVSAQEHRHSKCNRRHDVRGISFCGWASLAVLPHLLPPLPFNPSPRYPLSCLDTTTCAAAE